MANQIIFDRLEAIRQQLLAAHAGGSGMSASTKGRDREEFMHTFLQGVLPLAYRFGTGDITDLGGRRSGQLDLVIERLMMPSLPMVGGGPRLYFAESVACVIEVKSNLANQWPEVASTSQQLRPLSRKWDGVAMGPKPQDHVPLLAVGYKGWATDEAFARHADSDVADACLQLDPPFFVARGNGQRVAQASVSGGAVLMVALVVLRSWITSAVSSALPLGYCTAG